MLIPSLLIVTDRGGLRAYKVEPNPACPPALHLIDSYEAQEAHGRYEDKLTDRAGRFQGSNAAGRHIGGPDEHGAIDIENGRRACQHVAARINELIKRENPEEWLLAVPAQIKKLLLDHVDDEAVKRLNHIVQADLLRTEPSKLASHFSALQPA